jgi:hypothetical protein
MAPTGSEVAAWMEMGMTLTQSAEQRDKSVCDRDFIAD